MKEEKKWEYKSKNNKKRLKELPIAPVTTVTLAEFCNIVYFWLLKNKSAMSVLEFFEDENNQPFEYQLVDVLTDPKIETLMQERAKLLAMKGEIKGQVFATLANFQTAKQPENEENNTVIEFNLK